MIRGPFFLPYDRSFCWGPVADDAKVMLVMLMMAVFVVLLVLVMVAVLVVGPRFTHHGPGEYLSLAGGR